MTVRILTGDVFDHLAELPDESVHCVVTSPPYFAQTLHALKMCEEALRAHMAGESQHVDGAVSVYVARAAIAKATGGA